jgi:hypothetical protein
VQSTLGPPTDLDAFLSFTNPTICEAAPAHDRFIRAMVGGDANAGFRPGRLVVPDRLRSAFGSIRVEQHDGYWTIGLPVSGTMFGLPLRRIVQWSPEGGDPGGVAYHFNVPAEELAGALRARGFPAKVGEAVQLGPPDGYEYTLEVRPDPDQQGGALFSCDYS